MTWSARPCGNTSKNKMGTTPARTRLMPARLRTLQFILLVLVSIISYVALIVPLVNIPAASPLQVGDVSPNDYQAPRTHSYISEVLTEEARKDAENDIPPFYAQPDPAIARNQIERLRAALLYIGIVRADTHSTPEQKAADIASLKDITLQADTVDQILALPPARWEAIEQESFSVLEQVMRRSIRDQDVDSITRTIPSLVSLSLNVEQVAIVSELVTAFVVPNS